jgi:phosphoglycolate phosphatase
MNHPLITPPDSIIFDLDGTLWDASAACAKAWNESFQQSGINYAVSEEAIRSFSGLRIEKVFDQHFHFIPKEKHAGLLDLYKKNELFFMKRWGGQLYPGVKEVLPELNKKYKLFIVSNCLTGYIENFTSFHQLQHLFSDFESYGNTGLPKSDNIKLVLERNKLRSAVYVGDTVWDYEACSANHLPFIYAAYGFGKVNDPVFPINDFAELPSLLLSLPYPEVS